MNQIASPSRRRPVILVLDDEEPIVQALSMFLEDLDYRVCAFSNPHQALENLMACHPDLIITDLMMPTMSGTTFIQRVRQEYHLQTPIILMSAARSPAQQAEADAFMAKPFALDALERLLARFLAAHSPPTDQHDGAPLLA